MPTSATRRMYGRAARRAQTAFSWRGQRQRFRSTGSWRNSLWGTGSVRCPRAWFEPGPRAGASVAPRRTSTREQQVETDPRPRPLPDCPAPCSPLRGIAVSGSKRAPGGEEASTARESRRRGRRLLAQSPHDDERLSRLPISGRAPRGAEPDLPTGSTPRGRLRTPAPSSPRRRGRQARGDRHPPGDALARSGEGWGRLSGLRPRVRRTDAAARRSSPATAAGPRPGRARSAPRRAPGCARA